MDDNEDIEHLNQTNGNGDGDGNGEKCIEDKSISIIDGENVCLQSPSSECSGSGQSFVVKVPRANSKLILQNMEEVLNSVKKKHRQKHRRKREQKKLAMLAEAEAAEAIAVADREYTEEMIAIEKDSGSVSSSTPKEKSLNTNGWLKKSSKKPLQEQQAIQDQQQCSSEQSNRYGKGKSHNSKRRKRMTTSPITTTTTNNIVDDNLVHHTPQKKNQESKAKAKGIEAIELSPTTTTVKTNSNNLKKSKPTTNAFEVMMNARNKTIGSNTPGKEMNINDISVPASSNTEKTKRKLLLQSWADRKGGLKRKVDEEMRSAYVEERLEYRAKRLKKMLSSGGIERAGNSHQAKQETSTKKEENFAHSKKRDKRDASRKLRKLSSSDSDAKSEAEIGDPLDTETVEFLSKLSSPTKKRDSLLGYFKKIPSPNESSEQLAASTPPVVASDNKQTKSESDTPKRKRGRPPKITKRKIVDAEPMTKSLENKEEECVVENESGSIQIEASTTSTSRGRPRRSCVEKAKYDYDLETELKSSTKKERKVSNAAEVRRRSSKSKITQDSVEGVDDDDDDDAGAGKGENNVDIIDLDSSSSFVVAAATPKKLAPLFVRSLPVPKPSPDPEAIKARQEFLRSGVPDKLKLEQEKQKQYDLTYVEAIELFPKISHMHQWSRDDEKFLSKISLKSTKFKFNLNPDPDIQIVDEVIRDNSQVNGGGSSNRKSKAAAAKTASNKSRNSSLSGITNCTLREFRPDKKLNKKGGGGGGTTASTTPVQHHHQHLSAAATCHQLPIVTNKRQIIKTWKAEFDRFPTYKCYNQLRTKYRFFSVLDSAQNTEQVTESFVVTRSTRRSIEAAASAAAAASASASSSSMSIASHSQDEDVKPPATAPNGELLFTEKYKPMLFDQVLVNLTPVSQLRDFLASWASGNGNGNGGSGSGSAGGNVKNSQNIDDSMDFINDSSSSQQAICNSVVLLGPASSGKTNAVFTLANEMNFNVLEINAGMKRTGKKITQELLEATQSHQIRNETTGGSSVKSKAQKNLLKMSLKGRKQTASGSGGGGTNIVSELSSELTTETEQINVRKCLILIEDADIIFEQTDAGFTDAVYALAASSKRPVIIIATNPNCQHLQRLMAQNTINFTAPNALSISKYLAILSLMENCPVSLDDLISLYLYNQHDLRKTLHELQFFIQSGGDHNKRQQQQQQNLLNDTEEDIQKQQQQQQQQQQHQQRTPKKQSDDTNAVASGQYFASPGGKRRLSEGDTQSLVVSVNDENLKREGGGGTNQKVQRQTTTTSIIETEKEEELYIHRTLFEFYTVDQNSKWRIPFPVNFDIFYTNLSDIFTAAKKLKPSPSQNETVKNICNNSKRKSRSPKKVWLSNATATANSNSNCTSDDLGKNSSSSSSVSIESLNSLSRFYNNVSIANSIAMRNEYFGNSLSKSSNESEYARDRLMPYLSETIAHDILEQAININLEAELCPYNLFDSQKKSTKLCDLMGPAMAMHPKRVRSVDFEGALRAICRSEQERAAQERRSTRFYHYLRNSWMDTYNISQRTFENVCSIFQDNPQENKSTNDNKDSGLAAAANASAAAAAAKE